MTGAFITPYLAPQRMSFMARLFVCIVFITVFEGAFRKWISDGFTYPLVGLRDALAAVGIFYALVRGQARHAPIVVQWLGLWSALLVAWALLQILLNQTSISVVVLGLRFWLLYLWFSVLAAASMSPHDFRRISQLLLALLFGMAPLAVMQHFLPPNSFWNKQVGEGNVFLVTEFIARTTGTFSFTAGYASFLAMVSPFAFLALDKRFRLWRNRWFPYLGLAALMVATVVSGSRGAIIFFGGLSFSYAMASITFGKKSGMLQNIALLLLLVAMLATTLAVFSRAVDATRERFETAAHSESFSGRLAYTLMPQGEFNLIGAGIGMGSNFASVLLTGERSFLLAESENSRIVLEAGLLGYLFILAKTVVVFLGLSRAAYVARRTGRLLSVMLWIAAGTALFSWPITGQLTINALGYLLVGLAIAALRIERISFAPLLSRKT